MRPDQRAKLEALSERLADVFISEADPDNWTGNGVLPRDMSREERGDRLWDRKGAMGTGGVLKYTIDLIASGDDHRIDDDAEQAARDADMDRRIKEAEKRASAAVERVLSKAKGKPENDRRTHGNVAR